MTHRGVELLDRVEQLIALNDLTIAEQSSDLSPRRRLVLGTSDIFVDHVLDWLSAGYGGKYLGAEIHVVTGYSQKIWSMFGAGELDMVCTQDCPSYINSHHMLTTPLRWLGKKSEKLARSRLRLSTFTDGCSDIPRMCHALNADALEYDFVCRSKTFKAVLAGIEQFNAITAVPEVILPQGETCFSTLDQLPLLGGVTISFASRKPCTRPVLERMRSRISESQQRPLSSTSQSRSQSVLQPA